MTAPGTADDMNTYAIHELATIHQRELIGEADHARLVKETRLASRANRVPARSPLIWLRDTANNFAARIQTLPGALADSH
ncbi:MAG: hypothetical protein ACR2GO_05615 [Candidatus Limnocylindria bacterium]